MNILVKYIVINDNTTNCPMRDIRAIGPGENWEDAIWKDIFFKCSNCPPETKVSICNNVSTVTAGDIRHMNSFAEFSGMHEGWFLPKEGCMPSFTVQFHESTQTTEIGFRVI